MDLSGEILCVCREGWLGIRQTNDVELINNSSVTVVVMIFVDNHLYEIKVLDPKQTIWLYDVPLGKYRFNVYYGPTADKVAISRSGVSSQRAGYSYKLRIGDVTTILFRE